MYEDKKPYKLCTRCGTKRPVHALQTIDGKLVCQPTTGPEGDYCTRAAGLGQGRIDSPNVVDATGKVQ